MTVAPSRKTKRIFLAVWLLLPAGAVGLLLFWAAGAMSHAPAMSAPPIGAGAGRTGGANALGEVIFGNPADYAGPYNTREDDRAVEDPAHATAPAEGTSDDEPSDEP